MSSNALNYPKPTVVPARSQHTASIIWLHGLGDTADGWSFLPSQLGSVGQHINFIFPTAPKRPITLNFGYVMTGWYDVKSLEKLADEDEAGLFESLRYIQGLIQKEIDAGIPSSRILVGGFSQGGAIALMALRTQAKLAGIVGFSTYLPLSTQLPLSSEANKGVPVLLCHGDADQVINYKYGKLTSELLLKNGFNTTFKTYPGMGHSASPQEFAELQQFIQKVLPAAT